MHGLIVGGLAPTSYYIYFLISEYFKGGFVEYLCRT